MELEWKIFTGFTTFWLPRTDSRIHEETTVLPEQFKDRIIFMSMFNDIVWRERGNTAQHLQNCNALIATYTGRQALSIVLVEDA